MGRGRKGRAGQEEQSIDERNVVEAAAASGEQGRPAGASQRRERAGVTTKQRKLKQRLQRREKKNKRKITTENKGKVERCQA